MFILESYLLYNRLGICYRRIPTWRITQVYLWSWSSSDIDSTEHTNFEILRLLELNFGLPYRAFFFLSTFRAVTTKKDGKIFSLSFLQRFSFPRPFSQAVSRISAFAQYVHSPDIFVVVLRSETLWDLYALIRHTAASQKYFLRLSLSLSLSLSRSLCFLPKPRD